MKKSFKQLLVQRLRRDYGLLGDKSIDLFAEDIIRKYDDYTISARGIDIGQIPWLAVAMNERHHTDKRIEATLLKLGDLVPLQQRGCGVAS